jgi:hypothetical protein
MEHIKITARQIQKKTHNKVSDDKCKVSAYHSDYCLMYCDSV